MDCPDCKGSVEMELMKVYVHAPYEPEEGECEIVDPYYKCPKCKQEFDKEDLEE